MTKALMSLNRIIYSTRLFSYALRFNYSYKGRYMLTVSNRWMVTHVCLKVINGQLSLL